MGRMSSRKVLIAGASIAGPTLAYWLDRYGMEPTVVERAPELRLGGQNVDLRGAGRVVAARTGIEDAVRAAGTGEQGLAFVDSTGAVQAAFPVTSRDGDGVGGDSITAELEILRGDLAEILYDHTRDRVPYRFGDSITSLHDDGRRVRVGFEHGREEDFDLVIAADGLRSTTREITMPRQADIRFLGLCVAYFTIPREATDTAWWRWYAAGDGRTVTLRPDRHGTTRAMLSLLSLSAAPARLSPDAQKELMRAEFTDAGWQAERVLDGMDKAADFYFEAISQVRAPRFSDGRIGLLGDAAYCASPISGMGTTLALVGAYVLAGELGHRDDHREAFAAYESIMRPYVKKAQKLMPGTPRIANPRSRGGVRLLNAAAHLASTPVATRVAGRLSSLGNGSVDLPDYATTGV
jgi:2-polyprenyl-6-methoxyphenol hydroxylase-like FAD-dependent oxidoreductase